MRLCSCDCGGKKMKQLQTEIFNTDEQEHVWEETWKIHHLNANAGRGQFEKRQWCSIMCLCSDTVNIYTVVDITEQ